jgi:hypothetical protein
MRSFSCFLNERDSKAVAKARLDRVSKDQSRIEGMMWSIGQWFHNDKLSYDLTKAFTMIGAVYYKSHISTFYRFCRIPLSKYTPDSELLKMTQFDVSGNVFGGDEQRHLLSWSFAKSGAQYFASQSSYGHVAEPRMALVIVSSSEPKPLVDRPAIMSFYADAQLVYKANVDEFPYEHEHETVCYTPIPVRGRIEEILVPCGQDL